jgi:hypothetical protein
VVSLLALPPRATVLPPSQHAEATLAHGSADPFGAGELKLAGKTPEQWGVPRWRALVSYVHQVIWDLLPSADAAAASLTPPGHPFCLQSRVQHKGTPAELYYALQQFKAQVGRWDKPPRLCCRSSSLLPAAVG